MNYSTRYDSPTTRKTVVLAAVIAMVASLMAGGVIQAPPARAATPVAFDMVNTTSLNLVSHTNPSAGAFSSAGDGFEKYQRGVSGSIPFGVLDDSAGSFPPDSLGIIGAANTDEFFGVIDTENSDNSGAVTATWVFDISSASAPLSLSVDIGAMGDFEASDTFQFSYSIDGGAVTDVFSIAANEDESYEYTMEGGAKFTLSDPLELDGTTLTNDLATFTAPISGTGSQLTLTFTATADSGSEALAFQNLIINEGGGGGPIDPPFGLCGDDTETLISGIQGPLAVSSEDGNKHVVEAVVVGDYQGPDQIGGYFLQEEDADADAYMSTSEGLFIADDSSDVSLGDVVRVKGTVDEKSGETQLTAISQTEVCAPGAGGATAAAMVLPVASDLEPYEGMLITIDQTLYVTDNFGWNINASVTLSVGGVLDNPTNVVAPGGPAAALQDLNNRRSIGLDDGTTTVAPALDPVPFISPDGTLRRGDTIPSLTGVLDFAGSFKVLPAGDVNFTRTNHRSGPPNVGGSIQVGAFNVLNYFTTIDTGAPICGPAADQDCRGADSVSEFNRQRDKIATAIVQLDAEVLGLMEIENAADNTPEADLVAALNSLAGAGTYDYIPTPGGVGDDAIRVALLYQPGEVTPIGPPAMLDSSVDPTFNDDKNRVVLAQTFEEIATGEVFTVAVNHFKSKGSACDDVGDPDQNDGQGNCNGVRTDAAIAQAAWLASDPTGSGDPDSIVLGDLNAYAMEDPIVAFKGAGYTDLIELFEGPGEYSYVFFGQDGYLDHALSSVTVTSQVTGADFWHINADEPSGLDYNLEGRQLSLYKTDQWRSSDHDPVLVGLDMATPQGLLEKAMEDLDGIFPTGKKNADKWIWRAIVSLASALDTGNWTNPDIVDPEHGDEVFDAIEDAVRDLVQVRGASADDAEAVAQALVDIADWLARGALDDMIDAGVDPALVEKAELEYAKALQHWDADQLGQAVHFFGQAWHFAMRIDEIPARFATYNASMNRNNAGDLVAELSAPGSPQPAAVAEIIQRTRPDVLLINEFDWDASGQAAALFQENYLSVSQRGADPIVYPHRYVADSNTGVPSGFDLDNSGGIGDFGPGDAYGFGFFEGQYAFVVYSMYPIDTENIREFQHFKWQDMPDNLIPDGYYDADELDAFRLSSKNHVDVPIVIGDDVVHFLVSHPTPPVFDDPIIDQNGTRNHDEIRFWADYVSGDGSGDYIYDDDLVFGGLPSDALFIVAGDQNADPFDGDSTAGAALWLTDNPRFNHSSTPSSLGGPEQAALQGLDNSTHIGDPAYDTSDFGEPPGNLRADYVLPGVSLTIVDSGVFWPLSDDPLYGLVSASDHRLVWIDVLR